MALLLFLLLSPLLAAALEKSLPPVANFEMQRGLGAWQEIARMPHWFERDQKQMTATFSANPDGKVKLLTRGFHTVKNKWIEHHGKVRPASVPPLGLLEISFLGFFWHNYIIFEMDPEYQWVMISGHGNRSLWLLARTHQIDRKTLDRFAARVRELGHDPAKIQWMD